MVGPRLKSLLTFLKEIRVEHTLFALPFAYTGAIFAAHGLPSAHALIWITLAVLGARTAAMAANRYFDRAIDARNPRTAGRAIPSGRLAPSVMLWAALIGIAVLVIAAWQLNPLCVKLLPVAALGALFYPLCKRFTWSTHFVLGAVDALAPLGAFIAIRGTVDVAAILLFLAVTVWVAGFDILYALMDLQVDRTQAIRSLPARFGETGARRLAMWLHMLMAALLTAAGIFERAGALYALGILAAIGLLIYEGRLLATVENIFALNDRVFTANMAFSVVFLATTLAAFTLA
ncbi:MAG TPA: UbiA-like polyprenyltransferase [Candidatus Rubrimentiphilum sp.]|nr:UbiA-like polyprenyltransferase [Candidatus Rubrimentiphilum sp.]